MNKNKPNIIEEQNKLLISIHISTTKIKEIIFEINEKEKSYKENIKELYSMINNLKSYYDNIIQEQNKKIKTLEDKITKLENNNIRIKDINPQSQINDIFSDSVIVNNNKTYILNLMKWISPYNQKFTTKLLFRKSINGDSYDEFHRLCDNQGTTLVLIEGEEGFIIGGYTTKDWDTSEKWYKDENSFLFNLTNLQIFRHIKGKDSIRGSKENGPWFSYIGFKDKGHYNLNIGYFYYKKYKCDICFENYNSIIQNKEYDRTFNVKEVEIYKITKN